MTSVGVVCAALVVTAAVALAPQTESGFAPAVAVIGPNGRTSGYSTTFVHYGLFRPVTVTERNWASPSTEVEFHTAGLVLTLGTCLVLWAGAAAVVRRSTSLATAIDSAPPE